MMEYYGEENTNQIIVNFPHQSRRSRRVKRKRYNLDFELPKLRKQKKRHKEERNENRKYYDEAHEHIRSHLHCVKFEKHASTVRMYKVTPFLVGRYLNKFGVALPKRALRVNKENLLSLWEKHKPCVETLVVS